MENFKSDAQREVVAILLFGMGIAVTLFVIALLLRMGWPMVVAGMSIISIVGYLYLAINHRWP